MGKTIAEKIFDAHRVDEPFPDTHVLKLDRVFCHEITTPIAITDLMARGMGSGFLIPPKSRPLSTMSPPPRIPKPLNREKSSETGLGDMI